jgi:hypothetical protein
VDEQGGIVASVRADSAQTARNLFKGNGQEGVRVKRAEIAPVVGTATAAKTTGGKRDAWTGRAFYLNDAELALADEIAAKRDRGDLEQRYGAALAEEEAENSRRIHVLGAQCEIAAAKALGLEANLHVDNFRRAPAIDPHWDVKGTTQGAANTDLRLRPSDWIKGRRYILVERSVNIGDKLLIFHVRGWIGIEEAGRAGRMAYGDAHNRFISPRYLHAVENEGPSEAKLAWLQDVAERNWDLA